MAHAVVADGISTRSGVPHWEQKFMEGGSS